MNKIKFRTRMRLLIVLTLLLLALVGFAVGKYKETIAHTGDVTITAKLAQSLVVQEHKAEKQANGTYELSKTETVTENSYVLIPGVDIPKDPHVVITGKTPIPAYLYLKVECTNDAITYSLRNCWVQEGNTDTYFYSTDGTNPAQITADQTIYILGNDTVYVSQYLLSKASAGVPLKFTATLTEVTN